MKPGIHCVRTHWIRGFMAFQLARRTRTAMLMVPVCPESGFLGRAVRPETARQTASRSSVMNAASALYRVALASVGCGTGGALTYSWGRTLAWRVRVLG